jgi:hypothetical protein
MYPLGYLNVPWNERLRIRKKISPERDQVISAKRSAGSFPKMPIKKRFPHNKPKIQKEKAQIMNPTQLSIVHCQL